MRALGILLLFLATAMILATLGLWIAIPQETTLNLWASGATVVLISTGLFFHRRRFRNVYTSPFFMRLSSHTVSAFLIAAILGLLNFWAYQRARVWELAGGRARLTAQTREVLKNLPHSARLILLGTRDQLAPVHPLLDAYRLESSRLEFEFVDAQLRPDKVQQYGVTEIPQVIVESQGRVAKARGLNELAVTNALIKLSRPRDPLILYSTGHAEMDLQNTQLQGGSELKTLILNSGFELRPIDLRQVEKIPRQASAVVVWGPGSAFEKRELVALNTYIENGGALLVALDPQFEQDPLGGLRAFLEDWGLSVPNSLLIDRLSHVRGSQGSVPIVAEYRGGHPVAEGLGNAVFFPLASAVSPATRSARAEAIHILALSSPFPAAWGDLRPESLRSGRVAYEEGVDLKGPLGYFAAYTPSEGDSKILAFGNSRFVSNAYRQHPKNFHLFLNSLYWLADQAHLASFDLPAIPESPLLINRHQWGLAFYSVMLALPLALLACALAFHLRRRML